MLQNNASFELSIQCISNVSLFKNVNSTTVINIYDEPNQHIRMISEGSCDTENWSNDVENSALPSQK